MSLIGTPDAGVPSRNIIDARRQLLADILRDARSGNGGVRLFAALDAARDTAIHRKLKGAGAGVRSLYQGELAEDLAEVAPYLMEIEEGSLLADWLLRDGWGQAWGIYILSPLDLTALRRHLRKFNIVMTEDGRSLAFRYYDPRALHLFLKTGTPDSLTPFFGPLAGFVAEEDAGEQVAVYTLTDGTLTTRHRRPTG